MEDTGLMQGCLKALGIALLVAVVAGAALWAGITYSLNRTFNPDPVTIASASLEGMREQNRLSAFAASYVAVVSSSEDRYGLTAKRTLIMPGSVRYEVDLAKLTQKDVIWDAATKTLKLRLPPLEVSQPQIDLNRIQTYDNGGILLSVTNVGDKLDAANRAAGQKELMAQARQAEPMRMAKEATRRAVERSFAMPLKAAGIDAKVEAVFPDERFDNSDEQWDVSKSLQEVLGNKAGS